MQRLTVGDKLLIAALGLEDRGKRPFSAEDLVVAAWRKFPDVFGLAGYSDEHPDSNRVFVEIMGSKPLRSQGFLARVGEKRYDLTEAGRRRAAALSERQAVGGAKAGLDRRVAKELHKLFSSRALEKQKSGRSAELTFHDACSFWGISPRSSRKDLEARFANLGAVVDEARRATLSGVATFEHNAPAFSGDDVEALVELHQQMLVLFQPELSVIRSRIHERG